MSVRRRTTNENDEKETTGNCRDAAEGSRPRKGEAQESSPEAKTGAQSSQGRGDAETEGKGQARAKDARRRLDGRSNRQRRSRGSGAMNDDQGAVQLQG